MEQAKTLPEFEWFKELPVSITVCDDKGIILAMNDFSKKTFCKNGEDLIGHSLFDCHPPRAAGVLRKLLETHEKNVYTIEKLGVKKMVYQTPWFKEGVFGGYVEFSMIIPFEVPHFVRTPPAAPAPETAPESK